MELHYERVGDHVTATATGEAKEIAALVFAAQERRVSFDTKIPVCSVDEIMQSLAKSFDKELFQY